MSIRSGEPTNGDAVSRSDAGFGTGDLDQPGLRKRLELEFTRIASQHRLLEIFRSMAFEAIGKRDDQTAHAIVERFYTAWEAHSELEDQTYFPALHGLNHGWTSELEALMAQHDEIRTMFTALRAALAKRDFDAAGRELEALVALLTTHENHEEELLTRATTLKPTSESQAG